MRSGEEQTDDSSNKEVMATRRDQKHLKFSFTRTVLDFLKAHPGIAWANIGLALILTPISEIILPHMYGALINQVQQGIQAASIAKPLAVLMATMAASQMGAFAKDYLDTVTQPRLFDFIKTRMVAAMLTKYDGNLVEPKAGQIVSKIVRAPDIVAYWISNVINHFGPQLISFGFAMFYFLSYDVVMGLSILLLCVAIVILLFLSPRQCIQKSQQVEQVLDQLHDQVDDIMRNLVSIYSNDAEAKEIHQLNVTGQRYLSASVHAMTCLLKYKAMGIPLILAFIFIVTYRGCQLVHNKKITIGTFVSIFMIGTTMIATLQWLVALIRDATMDIGAITEAQYMFSSGPLPAEHLLRNPAMLSPPDGGMGMDRVTFGHNASGQQIFQEASLHIDVGERIVITGNIGSGKSTLVKLFMAFLQPESGDLYLNGRWYSDMSPREVRQHVAYMPQDAHLFDRTLGENILYGTRGKTLADARNVMEFYGLWNEFATLDKGLDTPVGKNGSRLSGGQRQLAYFSRILLRDPSLLILDEPTASMDEPTKQTLMNALNLSVAKSGNTVIMITHDEELISFATRRIHLNGGAYNSGA